MRLLFCALLFLGVGVAQVGTVDNLASRPGQRYLVEYTTEERCYDCTTTYAVYCPNGCAPPTIDVPRTKDFASIREALTFINGGMVEDDRWGFPERLRHFKRLLAFSAVQLDRDITVTEEPQPAKKTEQVKWRYGNEIGEVYPSEAISITATTGTELLSASSASTVGWIIEANPAFVSAKPGDCFRINSTGNGELIACPKEVVPVRHAQPRADKPRSAR